MVLVREFVGFCTKLYVVCSAGVMQVFAVSVVILWVN